MIKIDKDLAKKFMLDPQWGEFFDWFLYQFESEADIKKIDTALPSSTVHAEVIARQNFHKKATKVRGLVDKLKEQHADAKSKTPFR